MSNVTQILSRVEDGDASAAAELLPILYEELRKLAAAKLASEKPGQTLQPTALVHEVFLRLVDGNQPQHWNGRGHFFGAAAEAMRRILIENARKKKQTRRGGDYHRFPLDELDVAIHDRASELLDLNDAIDRLEKRDSRAAEIVKLRYFAGLSVSETAEALGISVRSVERDWTYGKTWLHASLYDDDIHRSS